MRQSGRRVKSQTENGDTMSQNITKRAWEIYRKMEETSDRMFTTADRKGKNSAWAEAMRKAYDDVTRERRIAAVQPLLKPVPKYNYYSQDYAERSEGRRREASAAAAHNMRILAEAAERPLNQKQAAEAQALGLSVKEYHNAAKRADENGMSVTAWMEKLAAENAAQKAKERQEQDDRHMEWLAAENKKKVAAMRGRYTRGRYARSW
jgi:hypothetical protein